MSDGVSAKEYERLLRMVLPLDPDTEEAKAISSKLTAFGEKLTEKEVEEAYAVYFGIRNNQ